ncbi:MAG: VCBS repeat-containing protein [Bacteroidales bacterium]|nr:VCBS repeat-containing protein [Bacteroidales bacterium]
MRKILAILLFLVALQSVSYSQTVDYGYPTNPDLTSTSSNTILPMGGAFNVGELGNATYTIPIEVPMGINGMQPSLFLSYNSLAGNGMCGLGFNIAGLSAISRVPGNYYYDDKTSDMVANSGYVALSMDGQRLINGSNGKYYIENDPNTDITLKNDTITVKQNGKTLKYRKINSNYQVYYLFAVTDNFGNRISYTYRTENNCVYPSTIAYGVGTGAVTICFVYETRTDVVNCFNKIPFQIKKRLSKIDIKKNAVLWRSYNLSYVSSNGFSKISQIVEKNSKGEQKYPTEFSWGSSSTSAFNNKKEIAVPNSSDFSYEDVDIISGDFNNDGIDDIAFVDSHYAYLYLFDNNSSLKFYKKIELAKNINYDKRLSDLLKYIVASQFAADIDGDGRSELLVVSQPFLSERNKGLNKISYDYSQN